MKNLSIDKSLRHSSAFFLCTLCFLLAGCGGEKENSETTEPVYQRGSTDKKILLVGVANQSFYDAMEPVISHLNKELKDVQLRLVASVTYEEHIGKVQEGYFDIVFTNGLVALENQKHYEISAKFGDDSTYYCLIVTRKDSKIKNATDLRGKKIAISGKRSIHGDLVPLLFLQKMGVDVSKEMEKVYFPSFESSILNVYLGKCHVAGIWAAIWHNYVKNHKEIGEALEIKWKTEQLPNLPVIIKKDVAKEIKGSIVSALLKMHQSAEGRTVLSKMGVSRMDSASAQTYLPLVVLKKQYDAQVLR